MGVGGVQAINQVGQLAAKPKKGDSTSQIGNSTKTALHDAVKRVLGALAGDYLQRLTQDEFLAIRENHQITQTRCGTTGFTGQHPHP